MADWQDILGFAGPARLTLVLGGARSGKSTLAEALVKACDTDTVPTYIATAEAWDDEMRERIAAHQTQRGPDWLTLEAPQQLPEAIRSGPDAPMLVDCLTLWLSNRLLAEADAQQDRRDLLKALDSRSAPTVLVSNEVGWGIVPDTALGRRFRDLQGQLNQHVAALADCVVLVAAGLPMILKNP